VNEQHITPLSWAPSAEASKRVLFWVGILLAIIGAVAFGLSFDSVMLAARPVFHEASWAVPLLLDTTLAVLTAAGLILELNGLRARLPQYFARVLIGLTVYANVAPAVGVYAKILHGAPPTVWAVLTVIAEQTIRRLVGLAADNRMEKVRPVRWLLAPASTFRLWRRMRLWEITNYRTAVGREQQISASRALLREWHGRTWRRSAPTAERLAVRLQGTSDRPVAELLAESAEAIVSAARAAVRPPSETEQTTAPETAEDAPEQAPEDGEQDQPKPRPARRRAAGRKAPKTPALRRTDEQLLAEASALNAEVIGRTGAPVSVRRMRTELRVGQPTAERIRAALLAAEKPAPEPPAVAFEYGVAPVVEYANGATV
jgi:Protein of unknown function (DUF2637)